MIEIINKKNNEKAEEERYQKELKEKGKEHVRKELETDNLIIYVPSNEDGAKYYGRNTKWCTTGKEKTMFDHYNGMGHLYIIQSKSDPKIT
jgi:ribosomal protein L9